MWNAKQAAGGVPGMRHSGQRQLRSGQAGTSKHTPGMHGSISINIKTLSYYYEEMLEAGHKLDQAKWGLYLHTAELSRRPQDPRMFESQDPKIPGYRISGCLNLQPAQPPPSHSLVLESSFYMNARAKPGVLNVFQLKGEVGELNPNISIDRQCNFLLNISSLKCWRSC